MISITCLPHWLFKLQEVNEIYSQEAYELSVNDFKNVHAYAHYTVHMWDIKYIGCQ